ncbi:MAG: glutamine-hydrolyzing GMP synthase, partial [Acidobacteriota bacterium]|nr:glutamine-hydrolyzing GMP synthase [Acidobacteriota bacterium]
MPPSHDCVLILDFGSQYTQLIARRVREANVFCEIVPFGLPFEQIRQRRPRGIILSGGPDSVYGDQAPRTAAELWRLATPVLGICYGFQLLALELGGQVEAAGRREYGLAEFNLESESPLFQGVKARSNVWMSHGDHIVRLPPGFRPTGLSANALAAAENPDRSIFGLQFHPEVAHTEEGKRILENFLFGICGCRGDWTPSQFIEESVDRIRRQVGRGKAICGLSGGVDSTVAAVLVDRAIGENLTCIFVNNGVLRKNEYVRLLSRMQNQLKLHVRGVDAGDRFLELLSGVTDPERKRKIIGKEFIAVFEREARRLGRVDFLVQGTLYP